SAAAARAIAHASERLLATPMTRPTWLERTGPVGDMKLSRALVAAAMAILAARPARSMAAAVPLLAVSAGSTGLAMTAARSGLALARTSVTESVARRDVAVALAVRTALVPVAAAPAAMPLAASSLTLVHGEFRNRPRRRLLAFGARQRRPDQAAMR